MPILRAVSSSPRRRSIITSRRCWESSASIPASRPRRRQRGSACATRRWSGAPRRASGLGQIHVLHCSTTGLGSGFRSLWAPLGMFHAFPCARTGINATKCHLICAKSSLARGRTRCGRGADESMSNRGAQTLLVEKHPNPVAASEREALLRNPGFGRIFTDHMVTIPYSEGRGWHDGKLGARADFRLDPAAMVLHYSQEIFEGMKAYRLPDGG